MVKQATAPGAAPDWQLEPIPSARHTLLPGEMPTQQSRGSTRWWLRLLLAPFLVAAAVAGLGLLGWFGTILTHLF
jgi:hypothetical protein